MGPIVRDEVQAALDRLANQELYLHLETTTGAYAAQGPEKRPAVGAFVRNAAVRYSRGRIAGHGPYRVGLKLARGWVYAEGLTHWEPDGDNRILLHGLDQDGHLTVALQLSTTPFR